MPGGIQRKFPARTRDVNVSVLFTHFVRFHSGTAIIMLTNFREILTLFIFCFVAESTSGAIIR